MKRVGIFVFFDQDSIVDEYVIYLVKEIRKYLDKIIIVSNNYLDEHNKKKLTEECDYYFERDNKGFDFGAWKYILYKFDKEWWKNFDEILFCNDTFYGPLYSLKKMFNKMSNCNCDYWGITKFGKTIENNILYPEFVQTYFWTVKNKLFTDNVFWEFWNGVNENTTNFLDVTGYEKKMSYVFQNGGFRSGAYIDTSDLYYSDFDVNERKEFNFSTDKFALELLIERGFPFVKRKNFFYEYKRLTEYGSGNDLKRALNLVEKISEYNIDLIFKNIIRTRSLDELQANLNLNYIIDNQDYNINLDKTAYIIWINEDNIDNINFINEIKKIQESKMIFFVKCSLKKKCKKIYGNTPNETYYYKINPMENINLYVSCISKYKYICMLKGMKEGRYNKLLEESIENYYYTVLCRNTQNVIKLFQDDSYLGILKLEPFNCISNNAHIEISDIVLGFWVRADVLERVILKNKKQLKTKCKNYTYDMIFNWLLCEIENNYKYYSYYEGKIISKQYAERAILNMQKR